MSHLDPFLKMGLPHCLHQTDGTSPDDKGLLKRWVRKGESSDPSSFSNLPAISSRPLAFEGLMLDNNFWTPVFFMWSRGMLGYLGPSILRSLLWQLLSCVNREWNCLWRMEALDGASEWSSPLCFNAATPLLSCCCELIYFQNGFELLSSFAESRILFTCLQWAEPRAFLVACASWW